MKCEIYVTTYGVPFQNFHLINCRFSKGTPSWCKLSNEDFFQFDNLQLTFEKFLNKL